MGVREVLLVIGWAPLASSSSLHLVTSERRSRACYS